GRQPAGLRGRARARAFGRHPPGRTAAGAWHGRRQRAVRQLDHIDERPAGARHAVRTDDLSRRQARTARPGRAAPLPAGRSLPGALPAAVAPAPSGPAGAGSRRPRGASGHGYEPAKVESTLTVPSLYSGAFRQRHAVPGTPLPRPMPAIAIRAFSATTALGRGVAAQSAALDARRGG